MSWYDGVPAALLYGGPQANYPAAAAATLSAQSLMTGASGDFSVPSIPFGFLQMGKIGQVIFGHLTGVVTASTTATTMTLGLGLATTAANAASATFAPSFYASNALTIGSITAGLGWELDFKILVRQAGFGTTTVATSFLTSGILSAAGVQQCGAAASPAQPVTTIDGSVTQFMGATVTFSTSSATNSCTLQQCLLYGMT